MKQLADFLADFYDLFIANSFLISFLCYWTWLFVTFKALWCLSIIFHDLSFLHQTMWKCSTEQKWWNTPGPGLTTWLSLSLGFRWHWPMGRLSKPSCWYVQHKTALYAKPQKCWTVCLSDWRRWSELNGAERSWHPYCQMELRPVSCCRCSAFVWGTMMLTKYTTYFILMSF